MRKAYKNVKEAYNSIEVGEKVNIPLGNGQAMFLHRFGDAEWIYGQGDVVMNVADIEPIEKFERIYSKADPLENFKG